MFRITIFLALIALVGFGSCTNTNAKSVGLSAEVQTPVVSDRVPKQKDVHPVAEYIKAYPELAGYEQAIFAGGCFWCTEAAFERIEGVEDVISGYSGGSIQNPTYRQVSAGATDHAEAIVIFYDPAKIDYGTLLDIFFVAHDPTQLNRQGPDVGAQYRSAIFYKSDQEKQIIEANIEKLTNTGKFSRPIVTQLNEYQDFFVAEAYHQNYYVNNPNQPYVRSVSRPKVKKVEKVFADRLKSAYQKN